MDGQPEKSNNLQEGSQSQLSSVKMKVETSDADSSSCNKDGNKTPHSPFMQGISSNRPVFGATGKLGSPAARLPFSFGSSNPFSPKSTTTFGASPKLNCASPSFGSLSSPKPVFLRPSQLAVSNDSSPQASNNTFPLKPSSLGNPFARVTSENENEPSKEDKVAETSDVSKNSSDRIFSAKIEASKTDSSVNANDVIEKSPQKTDSGSGSTSSSSSSSSYRSSRGVMSPPKFVPLGTPARHPEESSSSNANIAPTNATNASTTSTSTTSSSNVTGFVFGQNLHERVAEAVTNEAVDSSSRTSELAGTSNNVSNLCASATTNGTSEMLFTSVIKKDHISENNHNNSNSNNETGEKPSKSLSEAAREYEEARAVKRKYEEVQVITGEEDEVNVLQMNCKLFAFDKAGGTWVERGRGTLRLNDKTSGPLGGGVQSRVVIRTTGTLRVVLNTKIWAGMSVDRPSLKSVRLTAMDNSGQIKVFLVMCSPKETEQLHRSLECRVDIARRASASQNQTQNETKSSEHDLASHSLPPEPCSKKRLSEDSSPTPVNERKSRWESFLDAFNRKEKNQKHINDSSAGPSSQWNLLNTIENDRSTNVSVPLTNEEGTNIAHQPERNDTQLVDKDYGLLTETDNQSEVLQETPLPCRAKKGKQNTIERFWEIMEKRKQKRTLLLEKLMLAESDNGVGSFFESMSQTLKSFPLELIAEAKAQIYSLDTPEYACQQDQQNLPYPSTHYFQILTSLK